MRVGVDGTLLRARGKGVSRFLERLLWAHAAGGDAESELVVFTAAGAEMPSLPRAAGIRYRGVRARPSIVWDVVGFDAALRRERVDAALTPSDRARTRVPYVSYLFEVPDHRIKLARAAAGIYQRVADRLTVLRFRRTVHGAARVLTSSEATRDDLLRLYGLDPAAVEVVPPAPAPWFQPPANTEAVVRVRHALSAPAGYFLHFSSHNDRRDNTQTVLRAFRGYLEAGGAVPLLLVAGVDAFRAGGLDALARELRLGPHLRFAGFVPHDELPALYHGAVAYVDPSWFEGFGFQVAEALACGTPVICSDRPCLPEVVEDAGVLVPPDDPAALAVEMHRVASDESLAATLRARGLRRAARWSWARTSKDVLRVLQEVAA